MLRSILHDPSFGERNGLGRIRGSRALDIEFYVVKGLL
jgi:hypothetical protein